MMYTVLGSTGFIGRHLIASLRAAGHDVYAPARGDAGLYERPLGHVIYSVGLTADFRTRPFDTARAHVSVLADVLERCDFSSLIYLSSTRVYAKAAAGSEATLLTVDPADPSDLYNLSKMTGEALCLACGRSGVKVARLSNVVGHDPASENFLTALIHEALAGHIALKSHPDSSKDYILLEDVVTLLPRIAAEGRSRLYNVGSGVDIRHQTIVDRLSALTGCALSLDRSQSPHRFPAIDVSLIRGEFGFTPRSVLDALPELVATTQRTATSGQEGSR